MNAMEKGAGRIVLAATPLGNVGDASDRLRQALATAEVVAAEDTRRLRRLAAELDVVVRGRVVSYYEANEQARTPSLLAAAREGATVLLVTDAGMPSVSDPGYRLVRAAIDAEIPISVLPGPSAVTTALTLSGLPCDRFCFEGFPPRKHGERDRYFASLVHEKRTLVFFESPRRVADSLVALSRALGAERSAVLCRELTKTHEEVRRGSLAELGTWAAQRDVLGEITLVVAGADPRPERLSPARIAEEVSIREDAGLTRKDSIAAVAAEFELPKRVVYDAVVTHKRATLALGIARLEPPSDL